MLPGGFRSQLPSGPRSLVGSALQLASPHHEWHGQHFFGWGGGGGGGGFGFSGLGIRVSGFGRVAGFQGLGCSRGLAC